MINKRSVARCGALTMAILAALVLAPPAFADDEITIDHVETRDGSVSLVLSVDKLPQGAVVETGSVAVSLDGQDVNASANTASASDVERSTVLVVDASNSMRGAKFDAATRAVNTFLDTAPDDVKVGLVTFAGEINQSISPTADHDVVRTALLGIELTKGTKVHDALIDAVKIIGSQGSRSLLLLSDGADTGSAATLDDVVTEARDHEVVVDVVSLANPAQAEDLTSLANETGGSVIPAETRALGQVFADQADALAQQLVVSFDVPADVSGEADIEVTVAADGTAYTDSAFVSLGSSPVFVPTVVDSGKALVSTPVMLVGAIGLFAGLAALLWVALAGATSSRRPAAARRLDEYFAGGGTKRQRKSASGTPALKDSALTLTNKVVHADLEERVMQRLAGAGSSLTAAEWLLIHTAIALGGAMVGLIFGGGPMALVGLLLGAALPWLYLKRRHSKRLAAFNAQLAESLTLMAGGLSAGLSLPQSIDSVVREGQEPMAGELRRALVEQRLGVPLEEALDGIGVRMDSYDFTWVVMAIRIQREVGGNLAELMNTVADTLREREYLRRQVKVLSAEGRFSAYVLVALPIAMFFYMLTFRSEFVAPMFQTGMGLMLLGAAVGMLTMGSFVMSRIIKIEV